MKRMPIAALAALTLLILPAGAPASEAPAPANEHPGQRLVRENRCAACHRIGVAPHDRPPQAAPPLGRAGLRMRPAWIAGFLARPKKLRPDEAARMPDFRLAGWELEALTAFLADRKEPWEPEGPGEKGAPRAEGGTAFGALYRSLPPGDAKRGRRVFEEAECAKCHGDPEGKLSRPPKEKTDGKEPPDGPDLREMSRKLTGEGLAAVLFDPARVRPGTEMPSFFYDAGEPLSEDAPRQLADLAAYLESLAGPQGPARLFHPDARMWGRRLAWQFNCAGCHPGLGLDPRPSRETATPLGHRGAPPVYTREFLASFIMEPQTAPMHERMMGLARMPTFGFTPREALAIADWLLSVDGLLGRGPGGMMPMGPMMGPMR